MNYTADDFANARFAEHSDGTYGARTHPHKSMWSIYDKKRQMVSFYTDKDMARFSFRPVRESAPLTLDTLREAWENAEVPTENSRIRRGDLVIWKDIMGYRISEALDGTVVEFLNERGVRVLHRAPQPEPWADLADVLAVEMPGIEDEPRIEALAKALYCEHGVRVTGGDDDE